MAINITCAFHSNCITVIMPILYYCCRYILNKKVITGVLVTDFN